MKTSPANYLPTLYAFLAAALYALNVPASKLLLSSVSPTILAGLLYLGAGLGMGVLLVLRGLRPPLNPPRPLERTDLPYTIAMVALDIAAPIFLMFGIAHTTSANASLLNNFEIVATSVIAFLIFKESISLRLWVSIALVTAASVILSFEGIYSFTFNTGSVLVLCACLCWGIENNCTRSISHKDAVQIVFIKGIFSGVGSLIIGFGVGEVLPNTIHIAAVLLLGFVSYGLSIAFYIRAQYKLGAAKTSAFYAVSPFIGVALSFLVLSETPGLKFLVAFTIMVLGTVMMMKDTLLEADQQALG